MIVGSNILAGASGQQGYFLNRSVRLRSSASAYFNRTFGTPTSGTTWTWSGWVKLGAISTYRTLFGAANAGSFPYASIILTDTDNIYVNASPDGGTNQISLITTAVYRDPSAWYHVIFVHDSTQATASNRCKLYINGVQITSFSTATYPSQNSTCAINTNGYAHAIGRRQNGSTWYFDGYLTEINFIDGQALTPTSFGEYNTITGVWQPKKYGGTYGTNGFYLNFNDNSAATAAAIGKDSSGNGNNWTPNNISVTAGATYDSMTDVPTLTSATTANYATLNPLDKASSASVLNGNLRVTSASAAAMGSRATVQIPTSGKWYYEATVVNSPSGSAVIEFGSATDIASLTALQASGSYGIYVSASISYMNNGTSTGNLGSLTAGDIIQFAGDCDNSRIWIGKNNVYWDASSGTTGNPSANTNPTLSVSPALMFPLYLVYNNSLDANFGQRPFSYTPPTGFKALNTYNLPTPTIPNGARQFAATLYTATGTTPQTITNTVNGVSIQPDLVWTKSRSTTNNNILNDSVRGSQYYLYSNLINAENNDATYLTSFNSNGFSLGTGNFANGTTMVGWQWKASNAAAVTNTSGSITSQVSANPSAGFSIVTYTGTGANATVGHGLGVAPSMIIVKRRGAADTWRVYHASLGNTKYLNLNDTAAAGTASTVWNNTSPTSTVFSISTDSAVNSSSAGNTFVAYCFSEIAGYSKFGSYTGNGSNDGPFIYLGFRPRFVLIKRTDAAGNDWAILDSSRSTYNLNNLSLSPSLSAAESSTAYFQDFLSNGYKIRDNGTGQNANGGTYIYAAFAENPFKIALAR